MSIGAGIIAAVPLQEIDNAPHAQTSAESHNKGLQSINSGRKELHIASISPGVSPAMKKAAHTGGRLRPLDTLSRSALGEYSVNHLCWVYAQMQILLCILYEAVYRPYGAVGNFFRRQKLA